jgi:hypothetical protein
MNHTSGVWRSGSIRQRTCGAETHRSVDLRIQRSREKTVVKRTRNKPDRGRSRAGVAALDYVLVLGVILPMVAFVMLIGPRIMNSAYEMVCVLVSWPFM